MDPDSKKNGTAPAERNPRLHFLLRVVLFAALAALVLYGFVDKKGFAWHLLQLPVFFSLFFMAAIGVATGIAADIFFHWFRKLPKVRDYVSNYHEIAGHFLGLVGIIYAIVVGFVVVSAWQEYDHVAELSLQEERDVSSLAQTIHAYAPYGRSEVDSVSIRLEMYALEMQGEWKQMQDNEDLCLDLYTCERGHASYSITNGSTEMVAHINNLPVKALGDLTIKDQASAEMTDLIAVRDHRRHHYMERGLPWSLWLAFLFGAVILIATSYSIGNLDPRSQRVRTCALCAMILLMVTLALIFENPFTGSERLRFVSTDWCRMYDDFHIERHVLAPLKCS